MEVSNIEIQKILEKSRETFNASRTKKRYQSFNARRSNLEEFDNEYKLPSSDEMKQISTEFTKRKNINVLRKVRLALSGGEQFVSLFLNVPGSLYSLIGCFTGKNVELQLEAGYTIINLGLGSPSKNLEIAAKVGAYLVTGMSSGKPVLQDLCAWSYGNLCCSSRGVCELAQRQGIEKQLVRLLTSYSSDVIQSATYALTQYFATYPDNLKECMTSEVIKVLVATLVRCEDAVTEISWCLFISSTEVELCRLMADQMVIQATFNSLNKIINKQNFNISGATALVRVIINCIAAVPPTAVEVCYRNDQLVEICTKFLYSSYPHIRSETLQLIANVYNTISHQCPTGKALFDDNNLKLRLQPALSSALSSNFTNYL